MSAKYLLGLKKPMDTDSARKYRKIMKNMEPEFQKIDVSPIRNISIEQSKTLEDAKLSLHRQSVDNIQALKTKSPLVLNIPKTKSTLTSSFYNLKS